MAQVPVTYRSQPTGLYPGSGQVNLYESPTYVQPYRRLRRVSELACGGRDDGSHRGMFSAFGGVGAASFGIEDAPGGPARRSWATVGM